MLFGRCSLSKESDSLCGSCRQTSPGLALNRSNVKAVFGRAGLLKLHSRKNLAVCVTWKAWRNRQISGNFCLTKKLCKNAIHNIADLLVIYLVGVVMLPSHGEISGSLMNGPLVMFPMRLTMHHASDFEVHKCTLGGNVAAIMDCVCKGSARQLG